MSVEVDCAGLAAAAAGNRDYRRGAANRGARRWLVAPLLVLVLVLVRLPGAPVDTREGGGLRDSHGRVHGRDRRGGGERGAQRAILAEGRDSSRGRTLVRREERDGCRRCDASEAARPCRRLRGPRRMHKPQALAARQCSSGRLLVLVQGVLRLPRAASAAGGTGSLMRSRDGARRPLEQRDRRLWEWLREPGGGLPGLGCLSGGRGAGRKPCSRRGARLSSESEGLLEQISLDRRGAGGARGRVLRRP